MKRSQQHRSRQRRGAPPPARRPAVQSAPRPHLQLTHTTAAGVREPAQVVARRPAVQSAPRPHLPLTHTTAAGAREPARSVARRASSQRYQTLPLLILPLLFFSGAAAVLGPAAGPSAPAPGVTAIAALPAPTAPTAPSTLVVTPDTAATGTTLGDRAQTDSSSSAAGGISQRRTPARPETGAMPLAVPPKPRIALAPPEEAPPAAGRLWQPAPAPTVPSRDVPPPPPPRPQQTPRAPVAAVSPLVQHYCPGSPEHLAKGRAPVAPAAPLVGRLDPRGFGLALAAAARAQIGEFVIYNARYAGIAYPMGDVAPIFGVCTDVVVRAYRSLGIDLQELVHKSRAGLGDPSIDHRRVDVLRVFMARHGTSLPLSDVAEDYRPGDIVTYYRPQNRSSTQHIAVVTDVIAPSGRPMIVHNRGWGPQLEDALFVDRITGHYRFNGMRPSPAAPPATPAPADAVAARGSPGAPAAASQRRTVLMQSGFPVRPLPPPVSR